MGQFLNSIFVMFSEGGQAKGGQAKKTRNLRCRSFGGDKRDRTADLLNAIQALSRAMRQRTPETEAWEMQ